MKIDAVIKSAMLSKNAHRPLLCFQYLVEYEARIPLIKPTTETVLALDYSSPWLFVDSEPPAIIYFLIVKSENNSKELDVHKVVQAARKSRESAVKTSCLSSPGR